MSITVEFYGIPRERAGVSTARVEAAQLGQVLQALASCYPRLQETCLTGGSLRPGYIASVNGRHFAADPTTPLQPGDVLLIFSADAGG